MTEGSGERPPLGSAAEEAAALLGAAEDWLRSRTGGLLDNAHLATDSPACTVCPLCQAVGALRHVRPETAEHLVEAAGSLLSALRSVLRPQGDPSARPDPDVHHHGGQRTGVQRIDVQEG